MKNKSIGEWIEETYLPSLFRDEMIAQAVFQATYVRHRKKRNVTLQGVVNPKVKGIQLYDIAFVVSDFENISEFSGRRVEVEGFFISENDVFHVEKIKKIKLSEQNKTALHEKFCYGKGDLI